MYGDYTRGVHYIVLSAVISFLGIIISLTKLNTSFCVFFGAFSLFVSLILLIWVGIVYFYPRVRSGLEKQVVFMMGLQVFTIQFYIINSFPEMIFNQSSIYLALHSLILLSLQGYILSCCGEKNEDFYILFLFTTLLIILYALYLISKYGYQVELPWMWYYFSYFFAALTQAYLFLWKGYFGKKWVVPFILPPIFLTLLPLPCEFGGGFVLYFILSFLFLYSIGAVPILILKHLWGKNKMSENR